MAPGVNGNGTVQIPKWMLWVVGLALGSFMTWAVNDRIRLGEQIVNLRERVGTMEATRFTAEQAAQQREVIRAYIDARLRQLPGGTP
jgi:hypothetical protein